MKPFPTAKLPGATVVLCVALSFASLNAQTTPTQLTTLPAVEAAELSLPDAPQPQNAGQGAAAAASQTTAPASGQTPSAQPSSSSSSQQPPAASTPAAATGDAKQQQHDEAERELKVQEKQRLLGVMPQFQVVMGGKAVPLTGGEKWRLALHSAVDPFYIGWAFVIGGGWGEVDDSNSGYGWGPKGYFERVGSNYADNVNGALIGNALLPDLLHQDPRYFRKGTGSFASRFLYAALSTVICHGDDGKRQPNVSNVLGNYLSGAISNLYYPANERGVALTFENGTSVTLFGALGGQILEFGPDIARLLHHKKTPPATPIAVPTATSNSTPAANAPTPTATAH